MTNISQQLLCILMLQNCEVESVPPGQLWEQPGMQQTGVSTDGLRGYEHAKYHQKHFVELERVQRTAELPRKPLMERA